MHLSVLIHSLPGAGVLAVLFGVLAMPSALSMIPNGWGAAAHDAGRASDRAGDSKKTVPARHFRVESESRPLLASFMALLQLEARAEVLAALQDLGELYLIRSTVKDLGAGRYRIAAYGPETLIPVLEARGCSVRVLMTSAESERFHGRVEDAIRLPEERRDRQDPPEQ